MLKAGEPAGGASLVGNERSEPGHSECLDVLTRAPLSEGTLRGESFVSKPSPCANVCGNNVGL
eukprot:3652681-Amphidinium_carterae.1